MNHSVVEEGKNGNSTRSRGRLVLSKAAAAFSGSRRHYLRYRDLVAESGLFDEQFYLEKYGHLIEPGLSALEHFLTRPFGSALDPNREFDSQWYLRSYEDVVRERYNPLVHYIKHGRLQGRKTHNRPSEAPAAEPQQPAILDLRGAATQLAHARLSALLDSGHTLDLPTSAQPQVSIVILLHNRAELTLLCLESLRKITVPFEVLVVDNASTDSTPALLKATRGIRVIRNDENIGFGPACNQAARSAQGEFLLFLNNDAEVLPGALETAMETLRSSTKVGAVGARIIRLDGKLQEAGCAAWYHGEPEGLLRGMEVTEPQALFQRPVDFCSGCFLLTPAKLFAQLGGFHDRYAPAYFEDTDYCLQLWAAGFQVIYEPRATILHMESASSVCEQARCALFDRNRELFAQAHHSLLQKRPAVGVVPNGGIRFFHPGPRVRRILYVDDFPPVPFFGSGLPRARELVVSWAERGFDVTVLSSAGNPFSWDEIYQAIPRTVEVIPTSPEKLPEILAERVDYYDDLVVSRPNNFETVLRFLQNQWGNKHHPRLIYDAEALYSNRARTRAELDQNAAHRNGAHQKKGKVASATWESALKQELEFAAQADMILCASAPENATFSNGTGKPAFTLGHAIDIVEEAPGFSERSGILFVGSLHHVESPNYDGLRWFLAHVAPLLPIRMGGNCEIILAGYMGPDIQLPRCPIRVQSLGRVDDLSSVYARARVFISPTRYAAGIPLKCVEAAAHGVPLVVTDLLAEQLGWQHGEELVSASRFDARGFADALCALATDELLWTKVREGAYRRMRNEYSKKAFRAQVEQVFPQEG